MGNLGARFAHCANGRFQVGDLGGQPRQLRADRRFQVGDLGRQPRQLRADRRFQVGDLGRQPRQLRADRRFQVGDLGRQRRQLRHGRGQTGQLLHGRQSLGEGTVQRCFLFLEANRQSSHVRLRFSRQRLQLGLRIGGQGRELLIQMERPLFQLGHLFAQAQEFGRDLRDAIGDGVETLLPIGFDHRRPRLELLGLRVQVLLHAVG